MSDVERRSGLYPALLKHWRRQRGLSQLDLAVTADVSARHISFLETGRAVPSAAMVVQLATSLSVPLRHVNAMLRAAGHEPVYDETPSALPAAVTDALDLLKEHHEPFPVIVVNHLYDVVDLNDGAGRLLAAVLGPRSQISAEPMNLARLTFDPGGAQPFIANFAHIGRELLWRIQREALADPDDHALRTLLDDLLVMPTIDPDWRHVDLIAPSDPALVLHLRSGPLDLRFLTMITAFQAPQNITVEGLRIETWFPYDQATDLACRALAGR